MKYCESCELQLEDSDEVCLKCGGEVKLNLDLKEEDKKKALNANDGETHSMSKILIVLGYIIIVLGIYGSIYLATIYYGFNWYILIVGVLGSCTSGGIMLGLGEIIYKLHKIEINTSSKTK